MMKRKLLKEKPFEEVSQKKNLYNDVLNTYAKVLFVYEV